MPMTSRRRGGCATRRPRTGAEKAQPVTRGRRVRALAAALALSLVHGAAAQTGGNERFVCARYDPERAAYTATVAVLEPAEGAAATAEGGGAAYRLLVLAPHEDAPQPAPRAPVLAGEEALALLGNAEVALDEGRAVREESRGRVVREDNRLRFTSTGARALPRTMVVFTVPGLAIVESGAGRGRSVPGDGAYRCARVPPSRALLPAHCAQGRTGRVDLERFPAPRVEVRLIQRALDGAGMQPGPIDGIFGPRTLGALERWNERAGGGPGRILTYETLCPLIGTLRALKTP